MKITFSKNRKQLIILIVIVALGGFLRFYKLGTIPSGLYVDEAAIGYNAYSILKTGLDEHGKAWPVFLRSFNAYSSPLYMYLTIIPVFLFGLTVQSTRLVSALSGTISIVLIFLILEQFKVIKNKSAVLFGTLIFAISPWAIFYSRGAFEANLAFTLLCASFLCIIHSPKKSILIIPAAILLSVSTYAYQAQRLVALVFMIYSSIWIYRPKRLRDLIKVELIIAGILFIVIQIPQLAIMSEPAFGSRAKNLFYSEAISVQSDKIPLPTYISTPLAFAREFSSQYVSYISPKNIFYNPDSDPQRSIPELSNLYFWLIIPFLAGIYTIIKNRSDRLLSIALVLTLVTILPAALTKDPFSSLRSYGLLLPYTIIITYGLDTVLSMKYKKIVAVVTTLLILLSLFQLWRSYFILFPTMRARAWDYGYEELAKIIKDNPNKHYLIDEQRNNPSYIKLAFFMKTNPNEIQKNTSESVKQDYYGGQEYEKEYIFENVETGTLDWSEDVLQDQIIVGDILTISEDQVQEHFLTKEFEIIDPLGKVVFVGYKTNPDKKCAAINHADTMCKNK